MPTYTVQAAAKKKDVEGRNGPMQVINLTLLDPADNQPKIAEWFTKADTPLPQHGQQLEGELQSGQYGLSFKKAGGGFGGGGGGRKDPPETRRSIAMQHAQKCAVSVLEVAAAHGPYEPPNAGDVATHVKAVAQTLYLQVMAAENDEIKASGTA